MPDAEYEALLEKGRAFTLDAPPGQLLGRAGRRCTLEDGERILARAARAKPGDLRARVLLLRNLMCQAMGREREVPGLALEALREAVAPEGAEAQGPPLAEEDGSDGGGGSSTGQTSQQQQQQQQQNLHACSADLLEDPSCMPALQLVLLALKALHAQQPPREVLEAAAAAGAKAAAGGGGDAAAVAAAAERLAVEDWRARRLRAYVEVAGESVPGLAGEFARVERRLRRQLHGLGAEDEDARLRALVSREWLSAVDLAPPCGVVG